MTPQDRAYLRRMLGMLDRVMDAYSNEQLAAALLDDPRAVPGCRTQFHAADEIGGLGTFLEDVSYYMKKKMTRPEPRCAECGQEVGDTRDTSNFRSDAYYCSNKCRQRAYRKRVTAIKVGVSTKRNGKQKARQLSRGPPQIAVTVPAI